MTIDQLAATCFAADHLVSEAQGDPFEYATWSDVPELEREAYRARILVVIGLTRRGLVPRARAFHDVWLSQKQAQGWTRGEYDPARRRHPAVRPFSEMNEGYQFREAMLLAVIRLCEGEVSDDEFEMFEDKWRSGDSGVEPMRAGAGVQH